MCFRFTSLLLLATVLPSSAADHSVLRVCADPNNLPFSNQQEQGFENHIATLLASSLGARLQYTWWPERRSLVKNTLDAGRCDVLPGAPVGLSGVSLTEPYYSSSYVFVSRESAAPQVTSLNDPQLSKLRIGLHVVSGDYSSPGNALARRGLAANLRGYSLFGLSGEEANPPARLIDAVADGDVDIAVVWGPIAGYFGRREKQRLAVRPVLPAADAGVPFTFSMAFAVRQNDHALRERLNVALRQNCAAVSKLLEEYGVPRPSLPSGGTACEPSPASPSAALR